MSKKAAQMCFLLTHVSHELRIMKLEKELYIREYY
ncbi:hypothetical protein J2W91_000405 [Paenibacillus amylolyticus]|uniref:Uncharacterized protein n=1 Tax=Paenibacillus amylolyticus TaxID=1451 RepID=A0AAP5LKA7_PAEAM|nr:hypothetical protein [Paenibacillus amylolyticus]